MTILFAMPGIILNWVALSLFLVTHDVSWGFLFVPGSLLGFTGMAIDLRRKQE